MEPCGRAGQIGIELLERPIQMRQKRFILGRGLEFPLVYRTQHQDRVVPGGFPEVAVEAAKQFDGVVVPSPAQVVGQLAKPFERSGQ